jgi:hypothetical protein
MKDALATISKTEDSMIYLIRGHKVMLDEDLARIYGVTTKVLNQAVKRNKERFPSEFMFQLSKKEMTFLRSQFVTSNDGRGGRRYAPFVFTEHGAVMLASVLNSPVAIKASIQVVKAFVRLRELLIANKELAEKLDSLEKKYDKNFAVVFDAIRRLMDPPVGRRKKIGYRVEKVKLKPGKLKAQQKLS